jgi:hypothetical protein
MSLVQQLVERWGFPVGFAVWLMAGVTRDLREIRAAIAQLAVVNAVILNTLDVPEAVELASPSSEENA